MSRLQAALDQEALSGTNGTERRYEDGGDPAGEDLEEDPVGESMEEEDDEEEEEDGGNAEAEDDDIMEEEEEDAGVEMDKSDEDEDVLLKDDGDGDDDDNDNDEDDEEEEMEKLDEDDVALDKGENTMKINSSLLCV